MDSSDINKYLAGFLGTCFVVMSIAIVSDAIFAAPAPHEPGYAIEAEEPEAGGEAGGPAAPESVLPLLASANVEAGEAVHRKCAACHTVEKGGANKVGPNLWDIVNRPIATHEGFGYSAAMKEFSQGGTVTWDYDHLDKFLTAPKSYIRNTAMGFAGVKKTQERADLIAYLRTLSDNPAPLPEAAAQPAADAGATEGAAPAAPAEGGAAPAAPAEGGTAPAAPAEPAEGGTAPAAPAEGGTAPAAPAEPAPAQ